MEEPGVLWITDMAVTVARVVSVTRCVAATVPVRLPAVYCGYADEVSVTLGSVSDVFTGVASTQRLLVVDEAVRGEMQGLFDPTPESDALVRVRPLEYVMPVMDEMLESA